MHLATVGRLARDPGCTDRVAVDAARRTARLFDEYGAAGRPIQPDDIFAKVDRRADRDVGRLAHAPLLPADATRFAEMPSGLLRWRPDG